jgi:hypothetical protein
MKSRARMMAVRTQTKPMMARRMVRCVVHVVS